MVAWELVGGIAATLTTLAFLPQTIRCFQADDLSSISLSMYAVFSLGVVLWIAYGLSIDSLPVVAANGVTLVLSLSILVLKIRSLRRARRATQESPV